MTARAPRGVLYITYDGVLEPLGQSQVVAYLEKLAGEWPIHILSFEKQTDFSDQARRTAMRDRLSEAGIGWTPLRYHKAPTVPATFYDIAQGTVAALSLALRHRVAILHARSYVPALIATVIKRLTGARFLFDMRGFWADERVDGGLWPPGGRLYRATKSLERRFVEAADYIVTLTHASAREIARFPYLESGSPPLSVIPTCADLERFSPQPRPSNQPFTFGYVGSLGTWYMFDEVLACFRLIAEREPEARLLIVNRNEHAAIRDALAEASIDPARVEIVAAEHRQVPALVSRMNAAAAIIKPVYSKIASAPTKLAEYLGCGVPCLGNTGVGDMAEILEGRKVGVALTDFSDTDRQKAVDRLLELARDPKARQRCMATARELFSLEGGVDTYRSIYQSLAPSGGTHAVRGSRE